MKTYDVIIIGAGAAGLMCALTAGQQGKSVLLLEKAEKVGKKILISGGGRCNFTNTGAGPDNYLSDNPHFCKSALSRYTQYDFIDLVESHDIAYHEKTLGQLFCDERSQLIVEMLLSECTDAGVTITCSCEVTNIERKDRFTLETSAGTITADSLVIATGGISIPQMGATGFGYDVAKQFGLRITSRQPALVPFVWSEADLEKYGALSGVASNAEICCNGHAFREAILFTHKGLSGPAILQASSYWEDGQSATINWLPDIDLEKELAEWRNENDNAQLSSFLAQYMPKRLARRFLELFPIPERDPEAARKLHDALQNFIITPARTEGFQKAEVTRGGVDTRDLSSKTFEANDVPGLHFIGEVIDVTGWLGGYNFQWAWASGHCAGLAV